MSVSPVHYFLSSPYMIKEMDAALLLRAPYLMRKHKQQLTRLRRADAVCSYLIDDKDRLILSPSTPLPPRTRPLPPPLPLPSDADSDSDSDPPRTLSPLPTATAVAPLPAAHRGFRYPDRPLLLFWLDGGQRHVPFHLALHCLATHPLQPPPPLALVSGGALGLRSSVLDHKTTMNALLTSAGRTYIPATHAFSRTTDWRDGVEQWLAEGTDGDFAIVKPSEGIKQKGLLVVPRAVAELEAVVAHVGEWRWYRDWVMQALVTDPLCVSGLDLGLVKGSPLPPLLPPAEQREGGEEPNAAPVPPPLSPQKGRRRTLEPMAVSPVKPRRFSFPNPAQSPSTASPTPTPDRRRRKAALPNQHPPEATALSSLVSSPGGDASPSAASAAASPTAAYQATAVRAGAGQLPSDSGLPLDCLGLYKVHFRVYGLLRYDGARDEYALSVCDLFKLYHSMEPMAYIRPAMHSHPAAAPALTAASNHAPTLLPPLTSLPASHPVRCVASPWAQGQAVSNSLAMRVGNDILSPALIAHVWPSFTAIVVDCISLALPELRPWDGVGAQAFQLYGFDFLWDVRRDEAVLLEINENVGQGIQRRDVLCGQGMEVREYERMKAYWKEDFRRPFSEGVIHRTVDYALGRPAEPCVWKEVKRWSQGHTARAERPTRVPKSRLSRPAAMINSAPLVEEAKESMQPPQEVTEGRGERRGQGRSAESIEAARQRRRSSSHRRLAAALELAKQVAGEGGGDEVRPFLTGQPRSMAKDDRQPRPTRAELHARYAVRARRRSLEVEGAVKVEPAGEDGAGAVQEQVSTPEEESQSEGSQSAPSSSSLPSSTPATVEPVVATTEAEAPDTAALLAAC